MPKKKNKERKDGRYAAQVYLGTVDGKRKYKTVYGATNKEAQDKATELKAKMNKGIDISKENDSFKTWADLWLASKEGSIGSSQKANYNREIKRLNGYFEKKSISSISLSDVQQVINSLAKENKTTGKPASKRLLNLTRQTALQIFQFAIDNRVIDYNPARSVKVPKSAPTQKRRALDATEIQRVTEYDHEIQIAAMIMMYAGLRKGELIPLTWADIDLNEGTITVNKAVEYINDDPQLKPPKTENGIRTVYIPDILIDFLKNVPRKTFLVFPNPSGEMWHKKQFGRAWHSYLLDMDIVYGGVEGRKSKCNQNHKGIEGIQPFTPHMLRHTFCSMMYKNGVDVVTAKEQMGHADIKTTLGIYTHLTESHAKTEMQKMNPQKDNASQMQVRNP
ncbi:MAG: site-specific integrase [Clostridia bacterium]|nr:site-specific integrase [Clostridia bacterium]